MYADIRRPAVVRCVLHAVRCILYAACCVLHVVCCCTSSVTCGILYGLRSVTAADGRGGAVELPLAGLESPVRAVPLSLTHAHRHARTLVPRGSRVFASFGKEVKFTRVGSTAYQAFARVAHPPVACPLHSVSPQFVRLPPQIAHSRVHVLSVSRLGSPLQVALRCVALCVS
jgi:hypothetical protein